MSAADTICFIAKYIYWLTKLRVNTIMEKNFGGMVGLSAAA